MLVSLPRNHVGQWIYRNHLCHTQRASSHWWSRSVALPYPTRFSYAGWTFRRFQTFSFNCSTGRIFGKICNSYAANLSMTSLETLEKLQGQRDRNLAAAACLSALQDGAKQRRRREKRGLRAYERRRLRQRPALLCQFSAKENVFMDCNLYSALNSSACCNIGGENLLC